MSISTIKSGGSVGREAECGGSGLAVIDFRPAESYV